MSFWLVLLMGSGVVSSKNWQNLQKQSNEYCCSLISTFLNDTFKSRFFLRLLIVVTTNVRRTIHSHNRNVKISGYHIVKQMTELNNFYLNILMFRLKLAPEWNCLFFPLYQTPVSKSESFNIRSKETESADKVILNLEWHTLRQHNILGFHMT